MIALLSLLLVTGFLTTSLASYYTARSSLRSQIESSSLPLTSDNIYSEIQRDLLRPISISSVMANDTFLRDWILDGETDESRVRKYLKSIMDKYGMFTSFFVSESTRIYYHPNGILKKVSPDEERDKWYFRVREMEPEYELNIDPDMANNDTMTIFINYRVFDYDGKYIGATGVGLSTNTVMSLIEDYRQRYGRNVYFVDKDGVIVLRSGAFTEDARKISDIEGMSDLADDILGTERNAGKYMRGPHLVHVNSRFIPELNWYLVIEQTEEGAIRSIHSALVTNLILCALISIVAIALTLLTFNAYQQANLRQQDEIARQHQETLDKNAELEKALASVRQLSGLLPICASCKKIRDDQGYWQQIEGYIRDRSEAEFSHGICPECMEKYYPDIEP
ncbi:MAG: hypothetical protein QG656_1214 [Candidatus Hydrogenedentes bacterium]|nr:hypothetical protein [Candidatus Hydrogenedentota bacterium]